jgi:hypothetical protein
MQGARIPVVLDGDDKPASATRSPMKAKTERAKKKKGTKAEKSEAESSGKIKELSVDDLKTVRGGICMNNGKGRCCGARPGIHALY